MESLLLLYKFLRTNKKERFDMILEPFQATMQLSLLSFMPIGTKLNIQNNVLYLHAPKWHQAIVRMYNNDNKEDIYFLFHVLIRFAKFYDFMKENSNESVRALYGRMMELSKKGIDNLILTYQQSNDYALLNILHMYRAIMENPDEFRKIDNNSVSSVHTGHFDSEMKEIDKIFINIKDLYRIEDYCLAHSVLGLLQQPDCDKMSLINGYDTMQKGMHRKIHTWICDNLIY